MAAFSLSSKFRCGASCVSLLVAATAVLHHYGHRLHSSISEEIFVLYILLHQYSVNVPADLAESALAAQQVKMVTLETRSNTSVLMMPGVPGRIVQNVGAGIHELKEWKTRASAYQTWLKEHAASDPDRLAILTDASDVAFAGCDDEQLIAAYNTTVSASAGARVVFGAEFGGYPRHSVSWEDYSIFHERRRAVHQAHGFSEAPYDGFVYCSWLSGYCPSQSYEFLNAGFMMGPVALLLKALELILQELQHISNYQQASHRVLLKNPEVITLDYTGSLVLNIGHFAQGVVGPVLQPQPGNPGRIYNNVLQATQCFIHGQSMSGKIHVNNVTWLLNEKRGHEPKFPVLNFIWDLGPAWSWWR